MAYSNLRLLGRVLAPCLSVIALVGCSAATSDVPTVEDTATDGGHDGSASSDGSKTADGPICSYAPLANDPACPASYTYSFGGKACAPIGLMCGYPGAGDGTADGCFSTAMLWCRGDAGSGAGDAGADAGGGTWVAAQ